MSGKTTLMGLAMSFGLASGVVPAQQKSYGIGQSKATSLTQLRVNPSAFKNIEVSFSGQFMGIGTVHNPFFTRFTRADYVNFAVWGYEQKIWDRTEYDNPCSTIFCSKKAPDALINRIYSMRRYQRVTVTGIVRNVFQGEPWIELTSFVPHNETTNVVSLSHMARARQWMKAHRWKHAMRELNMAMTGGLPAQTLGWIHTYLGVCFMRGGQLEKAMSELRIAKSYLGNHPEIIGYMTLLNRDPRRAVDLGVSKQQFSRSQRPMWEAFELSRKENQEP